MGDDRSDEDVFFAVNEARSGGCFKVGVNKGGRAGCSLGGCCWVCDVTMIISSTHVIYFFGGV